MRSIAPRPRRHPQALGSAGGLGLLGLLGLLAACLVPAAAEAAVRTRVIRYHGVRLTVPAGWPVYRLDRDGRTCVRFDRHAVYLGRPGADERCPATLAAGRTEAILVEPGAAAVASSPALPLPTRAGAAPAGRGAGAEIVEGSRRVLVTATWNHHPALVAHALGVRSMGTAVARTYALRRAAAALSHTVRRAARSRARAAAAGSQPGQVYTGSGFDACSTPSASQMAAWGSSPYRALGVYIGGANMACSQPNLTSSWVAAQSAAGWHLVPIYVGLQAPSNSCGCAAMSATPSTAGGQGTAAADDAIADAQAIGLGPGNPIDLDMEAYGRTSTNSAAVLAFIAGWTNELHAHGYGSGVYGSLNSGVADLIAQQGSGYHEPDDVWYAAWNDSQSTTDGSIPSQDWPSHQRLHQYQGGHNESYGGATINIDGDYIDAATAAYGTGPGFPGATPAAAAAPSLSVSPGADGTVALSPSWPYESGLSSWQLMGGQSPSSLAPIGTPVSAGRSPIVSDNAYSYFAVSGVASNGQILGSSAAVPTPSHVAIFGRSVFVPRRGLIGVPVACDNPGGCSLTTTVALGNSLVARTTPERSGAGGGLAWFAMNAADHTLLQRRHRLGVQVTVRDASGLSATRTLTLAPFTTAGRSGPRNLRPAHGLQLIGTGDFVSNGWVGGILAECTSAVPCEATTTISVGRQVLASTRPQTLGVGEVGYLMFTLTPAGHRLLARAPGNQLSVWAKVATGDGTAGGHLILSAY